MLSFLRGKNKKNILASSRSQMAWIVSTLVLAIVFVGVLVAAFYPNGSQPGSPTPSRDNKTTITLPLTLVYNAKTNNQKPQIQVFLDSLVNPQTGLQATALQDTWVEADSNDGQKIIQESESAYLPIAFFDKMVEQHPQFQALSPYLQKKGDHYYFHLRPLEFLKTPPVQDGHVKGAALDKAKVVILEYGSFSCHFCQQMEEVLTKIMADFPGQIAVVYKSFDRGGLDGVLGQAGECANESGMFWQMHDAIFADQEAVLEALSTKDANGKDYSTAPDVRVRDYLQKKASALKLNSANFLACLDSKKYANVIEQNTREAMEYGINGTPAFFVNKEFSDGASSYEDFKALVQSQLISQ